MTPQDQSPSKTAPPSIKSAPATSEKSKNVLIYALSMAFGTMSSRILGLVREMAFAALFDRTVTDAWTTAFRLPNMFRRLLGEGALSVSFIPIFVETREKDGHVQAQNLVNGVYTLLLLLLVTLTVGGIVFAEPILKLMLSDVYEINPEKMAITVRMTQIMFLFVFLISSYAYFMGILNALGKFALAAFAPVFWNVAMIISTLMPIGWFQFPGEGLAWGVVVGGLLQAAVLVPSLLRSGYFPHVSSIRSAVANPGVRRVFGNMLPGLLGLGLLQITTLVNLRFASSLGEGPISYIYWADRLMELPLSLVSVSLGVALLPTLSAYWARGDRQGMIHTSQYYLRLNLFAVTPAAVGLFALALPFVQLLFMRGHFKESDAIPTAQVIQVWSVILIFSSCVRVIVPAFYAIKKNWIPAAVSGVCLVAHVIIAPLLMHHYGLIGLVSSSGFSIALNFVLLAFAYRLFVGELGWGGIFLSVVKFAIAGAVLFFFLQTYPFVFSALSSALGEGSWNRLISVVVVVLGGAVVFAVVAKILRTEEMAATVETLFSKIRRRLKKS